jgi:16S rRNA (guanine966-N2)-methyltransferase
MRQAIFDMILHAPWGGRALLEGADVLDAFAGTGAMGLEALSRGAASAVFIEQDRAALAALRANIAACGMAARAQLVPGDALHPPPGTPCRLVFLDPPYGRSLVAQARVALRRAGYIAPDTIIVAEAEKALHFTSDFNLLAHRLHGAAQVAIWREA